MERNIKDLLRDLRINLERIYRQRLKKFFLFGSYARGESGPESDIDIGLVLDDFADVGEEIDKTSAVVSELSLRHNVVISLHPLRERDWNSRRTPLILNLIKEGIAV